MKLQITVTKSHIKKAMWCEPDESVYSNCAIALAVRDIFPDAHVHSNGIYPFGILNGPQISLPLVATQFILKFDGLHETPEKRAKLKKTTFEVFVTDAVINKINISDLEKSENLKLV